MTPERLWLLAIGLRRRGHPRLAKRVKQLNSAIYHNSLATGADVSPDLYLGHHGMGTVVHDLVTIGRRVKIWHNVTLAVRAPSRPEHRITVEDDVMIGTGATIITPRSQSLCIGAAPASGRARSSHATSRPASPWSACLRAPWPPAFSTPSRPRPV